jgi:DNA helicase II / ATP-dependent DNA helicase PcrA
MSEYLESPEQTRLIRYQEGEGALLVVASAGSGKTHILTERVRYLLTEKIGRFSVLCLTFTNKAAEEMKDRLNDVPDIKRRAFIGTIHGFALEILVSRRHHLGIEEIPHILERESDRLKMVEQVLIDNPFLQLEYELLSPKDRTNKLYQHLQWISEQKRKLIVIDDNTIEISGWTTEQLSLFKSYNGYLREQQLIDYEDILLYAYRILTEFPAIASLYRRLYPYILIDEAQDLSLAQYELIKAICGESHKNVFMVGDPNQAIHGYAGGSKAYMLGHFLVDFSAQKEEIKKNYRCSKSVIELAQLIMPNGSNSEDSAIDGLVSFEVSVDEKAEAKWVFEKIKALIYGTDWDITEKAKKEIAGKITLDRIAILARNRFVFKPLQEFFDADPFLQKNYFVKKSTEVLEMESTFMRIFDLGTRILCNPHNELHFQQILNEIGISSSSDFEGSTGLIRLQKIEIFLKHSSNIFEKDFEALINAWRLSDNQMTDSLALLKNHINSKEDNNERALAQMDLEEYEIIWKKFLSNATSKINLLTAFRQFAAMGIVSSNKNRGLTLATIHTVKGLQFEIVFIIGMNEGTFPDFRAKTDKQLQEERNVLYVAITRSKRWLFLSYPLQKMMPWGDLKKQDPSKFMLEAVKFNGI